MGRKKKSNLLRYRVVETRTDWDTSWRAAMVVSEDDSRLQCMNPYACRSGAWNVHAPSLERVTVPNLKLDFCEARIGPVLEAPIPPRMGWWEAVCGYLRGRIVYVCPQCDGVGKYILRGTWWRDTVGPDEMTGVVIRESEAAPDAQREVADSPFAEDDFHCPRCDLDWRSQDMLRDETDDADNNTPTVLRYRIIELQREGEARCAWVAYEQRGSIVGYKPSGFLHMVPLRQVGLENLTAADVMICSEEVVAIHPVMEAPCETEPGDLAKAFESSSECPSG